MNHPFKTYPARQTFGVFNEPQDASDYISQKKNRTAFCGANLCTPRRSLLTQGELLRLNNSNFLNYYNSLNNFNPNNLNSNLITKLNLNGVNVVYPVDTSFNTTPYLYYTIDPSGQLFGNTQCGRNNYLNYRQYNPPPIPISTLTQIPTPTPTPIWSELGNSPNSFT
jgi:hypothetical protein